VAEWDEMPIFGQEVNNNQQTIIVVGQWKPLNEIE
jgi:hypothetical protein